MKLAGQRGIRSSKWVPNEMLHADDINFVSEAMYTNLTALLASMARPDAFGENEDIVMQGFTLNHNNLLTCDFSDGIACSFSGRYLLDGTWGFVASAGDIFSVVKPVAQSVAFTAGGTFARIDLLEVRPIRTAYDSKSRQFKDPITGLVTSSPIDTKYEYGYEFAVREGDDTSALTKEQTTWTVNTATVGSDIAGKYVLFSARSEDYYIWYNTGASGDPAVSGRTGIEVSINAGDDKDAIALATRTELNSHQLVTDGEIAISGATNQFIITVDYYVNVTDGTNGDMGSFFDAIAITQGNGVVYHTAGWVKIAEVNIGASASAITQNDILDVRDSGQWENELGGTRFIRWRAEDIRIEDVEDRFIAKEVETALLEIVEGNPYYDLIIDSVADLELLASGDTTTYTRVLIRDGVYTTSLRLDLDAHSVKYLRGETREGTKIVFDTNTGDFILLHDETMMGCLTVEVTVAGSARYIINGGSTSHHASIRDMTIFCSGSGDGIHTGVHYLSQVLTGAGPVVGNIYVYDCYRGFYLCEHVVNCKAYSCANDGFYLCKYVTGCVAKNNIGDGFASCTEISNCYSDDNGIYGFAVCTRISSCFAEENTTRDFYMCEQMSGCESYRSGGHGFDGCNVMSACLVREATGDGFQNCTKMSGCKGTSSGGEDFDNCDYVSACEADGTGATYWGTGCTKVDNDSCNYS